MLSCFVDESSDRNLVVFGQAVAWPFSIWLSGTTVLPTNRLGKSPWCLSLLRHSGLVAGGTLMFLKQLTAKSDLFIGVTLFLRLLRCSTQRR